MLAVLFSFEMLRVLRYARCIFKILDPVQGPI